MKILFIFLLLLFSFSCLCFADVDVIESRSLDELSTLEDRPKTELTHFEGRLLKVGVPPVQPPVGVVLVNGVDIETVTLPDGTVLITFLKATDSPKTLEFGY